MAPAVAALFSIWTRTRGFVRGLPSGDRPKSDCRLGSWFRVRLPCPGFCAVFRLFAAYVHGDEIVNVEANRAPAAVFVVPPEIDSFPVLDELACRVHQESVHVS